MQKLLVILLLCLAGDLYAQNFSGIVTDGGTGKPLYPVSIVNIQTQRTTYTDASGRFSIAAKTGEQIAFSFIGYKTVQMSVPPAFSAEESIQMFPLNYELSEYIFRPKYTAYQLDSMERRSIYARTLARKHEGSIMSPISFIAEKLSGNSKRLFRFQQQFYYWEQQKFIESRYSPELVKGLTGLSGDTLANFMNANPMPVEYARAASELELKMWIRDKYKEWMRRQKTTER